MAEDKRHPDRDEPVVNRQLRNLISNAIILKSQPTKKSLKANAFGLYKNDLYFKGANGTMVKLNGTEIEE